MNDADDEMHPNLVGWSSDTPFGIVEILSHDERTCLINGTAVSFDLGDTPQDNFMELRFCPSPQRHVHAMLNAQAQIAQCAIFAVVAYTIAIALDRAQWQSSIPKPDDMRNAWGNVLQVIKEAHEGFSEFLRKGAIEGGQLGDPTQWVTYLKDHSITSSSVLH